MKGKPSQAAGSSLIPSHGAYRKLKSFQSAEIVYDATVKFCDRFIDKRSRTHDQMVQAARSGRQNIAEGSQASGTSKRTELKLVGIARASLEELLLDYEDFIRQRGFALWQKGHSTARAIRALAYQENRTYAPIGHIGPMVSVRIATVSPDNLPITAQQIAEKTEAKLTGDETVVITDVTHDSRRATQGSLFAAVRGALFDAHKFVPQVMSQGAAGVISELPAPEDFNGVWLQVPDIRRAMAVAAAEVQHHPSRELKLVGITGTNGKTTTAYLIASIPEEAGEPVAMTGTVEYRLGKKRIKADRTTPEAPDMQRLLRDAVELGCRTAVMECSSQAMDFHRCDELEYAVAVFTNLTRDHLDYHKTMENYWYAKQRLFDGRLGSRPKTSVINVDDPYGLELADKLEKQGLRVIRYGVNSAADVQASDAEFSLNGMKFNLSTPQGENRFHSPLVGPPHIYNTLAAVASGLSLGYSFEVVTAALEKCTGAPGRFERVTHGGDFSVVVDYAHSDDALLNVLKTARDVVRGKIITVFGCGGDRDRSKRAPMGEAAGTLSDVVILTSDNPRTEDPEQILCDAEEGIRKTGKPYRKIADRTEAINQAITEARSGDLVLIAGKGHEDYQIIGRETFHFDDKEVARAALAQKA